MRRNRKGVTGVAGHTGYALFRVPRVDRSFRSLDLTHFDEMATAFIGEAAGVAAAPLDNISSPITETTIICLILGLLLELHPFAVREVRLDLSNCLDLFLNLGGSRGTRQDLFGRGQ